MIEAINAQGMEWASKQTKGRQETEKWKGKEGMGQAGDRKESAWQKSDKQGAEERSRRIRRYINETDETQARNRQGNRKIQISGKQGKSKLQ